MNDAEHPFWTWSLEFYRRPDVERVLLDLQDRLGLDVNILLYACWTGVNGHRPLTKEECERLLTDTQNWRAHVTGALREIRRFLKSDAGMAGAEEMRRKVLGLELEAEHVTQMRIAGLMEGRADGGRSDLSSVDAALIGMEACLTAQGIVAAEGERAQLLILAQACCPQIGQKAR
jgi:uncharacterized protein (TIGR02444 family)